MAPGDLLIEIALFLETRNDLLNFCLTSKHAFANISSVLYETVVLESAEQCRVTLEMLSRNQGIARHVQNLVIRPQSKYRRYLSAADNDSASAAVLQTAGSKCLDALKKFLWDADELPYNDDMWFALRAGCPQLRYIGTTIGMILPEVNSHLFDFSLLKGFSLTLKHGFYEHHTDLFIDEDDPIFQNFSSMLIRRSPNLEELIIDGFSTVPADVHFFLQGRWPHLRKLHLGDICVDWFPRPPNPAEKRPFIGFLEAHPTIEVLNLSRHSIQPIHFSTLDNSALENVTHFTGTHQQLHALSQIHHSVQAVSFRDAVETRDVSAPTVASLLRELPKLTQLKIAFTLHSMYDSGNLLRSLIHSAPLLRHLELTCAHKPSFQLDSFAKTIRGFPKLRTLHLAVVRYPGDETLAAGAARIAQSNPHLSRFSLTFIPPVYPVPLPFALPYRPFPLPFPARATGVFEVTLDEHGLPLSLAAVEHSRVVWPWGLGVSRRRRKYLKDLRPIGDPRRRKTGLRGVAALVVEQSAAGDEMRMILFCAFLALLAGCGILANGAKVSTAATAIAV
ncbi:hypothetical protein BDN70DRAFT_884538 [Pholiota conissans]|uniref:Uncharacterized protein n=1 Tax=Pholiota conissans TaxID=109636 RepID=A0A9P5YT69_9AGAR|nr:hypothetical protein BDN70DRAFT_884538 [Pholiota conissans]